MHFSDGHAMGNRVLGDCPVAADAHDISSSGSSNNRRTNLDLNSRNQQTGTKGSGEQQVTPAAPEGDVVDDFTNDPHPALETPLLYFFLRGHPWILDGIQCLYRARWGVAYPFQHLLPYSRKLRKVRVILTWTDVILIVPFVFCLIKIFIYSFLFPSVKLSGNIARIPLIFTFLTAMRNNLLTLLLGMPVERVIKYHKISAYLSYFNSIMHAYVALWYQKENAPGDTKLTVVNFMVENSVNTSGTLMVVFITGMIIAALPMIRRKLFELFYYVHIFFGLAVVICAWFHTGFLVPLMGFLLWGNDLLVRRVYMPWFRYPRKATLQAISDTVVEVSFPKTDGFDFNPGQYVHIAIPKLSYLQWHPFSISSSPKQKIVTLHVRRVGNWSNDLYNLAKENAEVEILMEGPYGSVGVDVNHPLKYKRVMLFSGGIGVTPMQSLCNTLLWEHHAGVRNLDKLSFIWIERDPVIMEEVDVVRRESRVPSSISSGELNGRNSLETEHSSSTANLAIESLSGNLRSNHLTKSQYLRDRRSYTTGSTTNINGTAQGPCPRRGRRHSYTIAETRIANSLLGMLPQNQETDEEMTKLYASVNFDLDNSSTSKDEEMAAIPPLSEASLHQGGLGTDANEDVKSQHVSFAVDVLDPTWHAGEEEVLDESFLDQTFPSHNLSKESSPLDLQVYVTSKNLSQSTKQRLAQMPFVMFGRPNVSKLFYKAKQEAIEGGERRVAVCLCAPPRLVQLCRDACAKYSDGKVAFDIHCEEFS
jgi:predicted ferric reductase